MSSEKQREIARKGGRAAHARGTAHEFTADEARAAGRKGGETVSANRSHMAAIGRLGGRSSAGRRSTVAAQKDGSALASNQSGHQAVNHEDASASNAPDQTQ
jgi:general stress protein YciG